MLSRKPKKETTNYPDYLEDVLLDFCPETGDKEIYQEVYLQPAQKLYKQLYTAPASPGYTAAQLSRFEWQLRFAAECLRAIETVPLYNHCRPVGNRRWHWHRAVWNRGLVWGLGEYLKNCRIQTNSQLLDPAIEPIYGVEDEIYLELRKNSKNEEDKILLCTHPMALELNLYYNLAPTREIDKSIWLFMQNSFWQFESEDNLIVQIMEKAQARVQHVLDSRISSPVITTELHSLRQESTRGTRAKKEDTQKSVSKSPENNLTQDPGVSKLSGVISHAIESGAIAINCPGAPLHITSDNQLGVTNPKGLDQLALACGVSPDSFHEALISEALLLETGHRYYFKLPRTRNKDKELPINLLTINKERLSSGIREMTPNPVIIHKKIDMSRVENSQHG